MARGDAAPRVYQVFVATDEIGVTRREFDPRVVCLDDTESARARGGEHPATRAQGPAQIKGLRSFKKNR